VSRSGCPPLLELHRLWFDPTETVERIAYRYRVSPVTVRRWAARHGLPFRSEACQAERNHVIRPIYLKHDEQSCEPVDDGPSAGDPTPEQIAARAAEIREEHLRYKRSLPA
jgi:hypothetical protein